MFDLFRLNENTSKQMDNPSVDIIILQFNDILGFDEQYAYHILENPHDELKTLSESASSNAGRKVDVHILNLPTTLNIHQVHREYFYKLVQIKGTVMQRSEISPAPTMITYECSECHIEVEVEQTEQWRIKPELCSQCKNRSGFKPIYEKTLYDECQWIEVQELMGNTHLADTPSKTRVLLRNNLIDSCTPGETITLVGIPKVLENRPNTFDLKMTMYIDCRGLVNDTEEENLDLSAEDIENLKEIASQDTHLQNVIQSYAPTVYGEEVVKEALAYQQCEGVVRQLTKKKRRRGQFHVLLAGPPGVAKSDLGEYQSLYHHKGRQATGRGSSSVGLTASVVQENGEWVLKAGAMSLADNGLLFIDEIEKMRSEDSGAMHPGMEAQQIPISKAGINATIKTRCSIVAACNPTDGKWSEDKGLIGNLIEKGKGLTVPLLNRFALIFIVKEKEKEEDEALVVDHILSINEDMNSMSPIYDEETLRKLFIYARTFKPVLTKEASAKIKEFYLTLFKASKAQDGMILSRRQIEDLVRIAEASAKLHLREEVTVADAGNAIRVMATSLKQYGIDPLTGNVDQTSIYYGHPTSRKGRLDKLHLYVKHLMDKNIDTSKVSRIELVKYLVLVWGVTQIEAGDYISAKITDGVLYEPTPMYVSLVGES